MGVKDPRGIQGIFSRGANVYNGGTSSAHSGGGKQFGRPRKVTPNQLRRAAISRRLNRGR